MSAEAASWCALGLSCVAALVVVIAVALERKHDAQQNDGSENAS